MMKSQRTTQTKQTKQAMQTKQAIHTKQAIQPKQAKQTKQATIIPTSAHIKKLFDNPKSAFDLANKCDFSLDNPEACKLLALLLSPYITSKIGKGIGLTSENFAKFKTLTGDRAFMEDYMMMYVENVLNKSKLKSNKHDDTMGSKLLNFCYENRYNHDVMKSPDIKSNIFGPYMFIAARQILKDVCPTEKDCERLREFPKYLSLIAMMNLSVPSEDTSDVGEYMKVMLIISKEAINNKSQELSAGEKYFRTILKKNQSLYQQYFDDIAAKLEDDRIQKELTEFLTPVRDIAYEELLQKSIWSCSPAIIFKEPETVSVPTPKIQKTQPILTYATIRMNDKFNSRVEDDYDPNDEDDFDEYYSDGAEYGDDMYYDEYGGADDAWDDDDEYGGADDADVWLG